jgi:membrane associated rhomboid family serine protease
MSRIYLPSTRPPRGWVTLGVTFLFVLVFRLEQNVAFVLDISTRELLGLDVLLVEALVGVFAPVLHATAGHLVSTLVWFIPFGYLCESRTRWEDYLGFVVLAGVLSTTLVPALVGLFGVTPGIAIGASGITYALVAREATARLRWVIDRRALSWRQRAILVVAMLGVVLKLLSFMSEPPPSTSVVGHATGLVLGVIVGIGERYVHIVTAAGDSA